jgi:hypothetical protein
MEVPMKIKAAILGVSLLLFGAGVASAQGTWLGVNAGAGIPSGNYGDAASTGWNAGVTGTHMLNEQWGLGADLGYHAWGGSDALNASMETLYGSGSEFKWSAIQATGHAMFRIPTTGTVKPYARVGAGLYDIKGKLSSPTGDVDNSKSKLGFNFGAGIQIPNGSNRMWGIAATYHVISAENDFGSNVDAFSLGVNMMWGVGR